LNCRNAQIFSCRRSVIYVTKIIGTLQKPRRRARIKARVLEQKAFIDVHFLVAVDFLDFGHNVRASCTNRFSLQANIL
jgi:hypothetical protein